MTHRATGTFEVKLTPRAKGEETPAWLSLDKEYRGGLEGASRGEMLTAGNVASGSGGYVAIEKFTGKLGGRSGSFVLQHSGTMNRGSQHLAITVVPDSGTGELSGISGRMDIQIEGGKHSYILEYSL